MGGASGGRGGLGESGGEGGREGGRSGMSQGPHHSPLLQTAPGACIYRHVATAKTTRIFVFCGNSKNYILFLYLFMDGPHFRGFRLDRMQLSGSHGSMHSPLT